MEKDPLFQHLPVEEAGFNSRRSSIDLDAFHADLIRWNRASSSVHLWSWCAQFLLFSASLFTFWTAAMWRQYPMERCSAISL